MTQEEMEQLAQRVAERVLREIGRVEVRAVTYKRAAMELEISLRQVKRMVESGELATCLVGKRPRVPVSELQRITQPLVAPKRRSSGRPRREAYNAHEEARKLRELRRARRLQPEK